MAIPTMPKPSFKDNLMGKQVPEKVLNLDEYVDIEIAKDDVMVDKDEALPSILFSDKIHNKINATIKHTVVVRLLSRGLGYRGLETTIKVI